MDPAQEKWILDLAMHRFLTFSPDVRRQRAQEELRELAELGLYQKDRANLCCNFCQFKISWQLEPSVILREHAKFECAINAAKSKNFPMGSVDLSELNFKFEAHRLYSLLRKVDWQHVEPIALAKSGFYYTGDGDNVRCEFCRLEVRGWEAGDTPDGEHRRLKNECPFLAGNINVENVEIGSEPISVGHDAIGENHEGAVPCDTTECENEQTIAAQEAQVPPLAHPQDVVSEQVDQQQIPTDHQVQVEFAAPGGGQPGYEQQQQEIDFSGISEPIPKTLE